MNKKVWNFLMNYSTPNELTLLIYGTIGDEEYWDDVVDKKFVEELNMYPDVEKITVRINSPGGIVFSGAAIANSLQQHKAEVHAYIDGLCASAATLIACAADKVFMPINGMYMIHNPLVSAFGNAENLRRAAENLDTLREGIIGVYQNKVGEKLTREEIIKLLDDEAWMTAEEAKEKGFIDEIIGYKMDTVFNNSLLNVNNQSFEMKQYKNFTQYYNKINGLNETEKTEKKGLFKKILDFLKSDEAEETKEVFNSLKNIESEENIMTAIELKEKFPDVYNQIFNEGIEKERGRIKELEALNVLDSEVCKEIINKAKYEEVKTAGEVAVSLLSSPEILKEKKDKEEKEEKAKLLQDISADGKTLSELGADGFTPELNLGESTDEKLKEAVKNERRERMRKTTNKMMGVKTDVL